MLSADDHDGPGVVPGRYVGEAIPIHDGPTSQSVADAEQRTLADGLAGRICAAAAEAARSSYVLLELLGEFDATHAIRYWTGFKSLAHWLSWSCSMNPGWRGNTFGWPRRCCGCRPLLDCSRWVGCRIEGAGGHPGR